MSDLTQTGKILILHYSSREPHFKWAGKSFKGICRFLLQVLQERWKGQGQVRVVWDLTTLVDQLEEGQEGGGSLVAMETGGQWRWILLLGRSGCLWMRSDVVGKHTTPTPCGPVSFQWSCCGAHSFSSHFISWTCLQVHASSDKNKDKTRWEWDITLASAPN